MVAVLVVGAGPTGLLLASELTRRGVPCEVIDAHPGPLHWDRATVMHARSLEIFESLGLAERFLGAGTPQRGAQLYSRGELLGGFTLDDCGSRYGYSLGVSEEVTESILTDYLHELGGEVRRSCRLVGLTAGPGGARAEIDHDGEPMQLDADWVVGCDGIHSATREAIGAEYVGHDIAAPWAVFDTTVQNWPETYDLTYVYLESTPVILTALPDRRWRVYLRPAAADSDLVADATATLCQYYPDVSFVDVENPTRFHCHSMVATSFRSGRILLAGDAAHLCSPAQGHGMNTGLQDAENLAWKLALVHHGIADEALLDTYEAERRPPAQLVADSGDEFEHMQTLTDATERAARDQSLRGTFADAQSRHHESVAEAELNIEYSASPVVMAAGQRLPDTIAVEAPGAGGCALHELTRNPGHTVLVLGGPGVPRSQLTALLDALDGVVTKSEVFDTAVALGADPDLPGGIGRLDAAAAALLGVEGVTLLAVRPDGYIGLRADRDHIAMLERYDTLLRTGRG